MTGSAGFADLQTGCVRFIGDAATRISEDYLRILRFYRLAARFGDGDLEPVSHAVVTAARQSLKSLSRERIADELTKILSLPGSTRNRRPDGGRRHLRGDPGPNSTPGFATALDRLLANESAAAAAPASLRRLVVASPTLPLPIRSRAGCACRRGQRYICRRSARIATTRGPCVSLPMPSGSRRRRDARLLGGNESDAAAAVAALDG